MSIGYGHTTGSEVVDSHAAHQELATGFSHDAAVETSQHEGDHADHDTSYVNQTLEAASSEPAAVGEAHAAEAAQPVHPTYQDLSPEDLEHFVTYKVYKRISTITGYLFSDVQNNVVTNEVCVVVSLNLFHVHLIVGFD